jgi:hypothetical protein
MPNTLKTLATVLVSFLMLASVPACGVDEPESVQAGLSGPSSGKFDEKRSEDDLDAQDAASSTPRRPRFEEDAPVNEQIAIETEAELVDSDIDLGGVDLSEVLESLKTRQIR